MNCLVPWLPYEAILWLDATLEEHWYAFEWGCGVSTVWLARRVDFISSVEHDGSWYRNVSSLLREADVKNVDLQCKLFEKEYVASIQEKGRRRADFILVDGVYRPACIKVAVECLKGGGYLMLDNSRRDREAARLVPSNWIRQDFRGPGRIQGHAKRRSFLYPESELAWKVWQCSVWRKP